MPSFLSDNNTPNRNDPEWVILQKMLGALNTISGGGSGGGPFVEVSGDTMTGALIISKNGALSAPAFSLTGTPITGGSTSTTAPLVKIGSGTDAEYSTSGCLLALNAPNSFAGYIQQWLVNGSQRVVIDSVNGTAGRISISRRSSSTLAGTIHGVDYVGTGDGLQLNFAGGSTSRLALESGQVQVNGNFLVQSTNTIGWSDLFLVRDGAANTLATRNAANAQTFRVYNTYTDSSNYERGVFDWSSTVNALSIGTQKAGTGTNRAINILIGGTAAWQYSTSGNYLAFTDNAFDIGASGANRPRNVYIAGGVTHGSATLLTTTTALTNGAAAQVATLTNGPTAGNPTKWIPINDNGTTRYIPAW